MNWYRIYGTNKTSYHQNDFLNKLDNGSYEEIMSRDCERGCQTSIRESSISNLQNYTTIFRRKNSTLTVDNK